MIVPVPGVEVARLCELGRSIRAAAVAMGKAVDVIGPAAGADHALVAVDLDKLEAAGRAFLALSDLESQYNAAHRAAMKSAADAIAAGQFTGE